MAIIDSLAQFGVDQDISQVTGTYLFTNQIDLGIAGRDPGNGQPVYLNIVITEAVAGTSSTVNFRLRSDDSATIHATTSSAHIETGDIPEATLVVGFKLSIPIPVQGVPYERYLGLQAVVGGATTTTGKATAWLSPDPIGWKSYADASN